MNLSKFNQEDKLLNYLDIDHNNFVTLIEDIQTSKNNFISELEFHPSTRCDLNCIFCHTKLESPLTNLYYVNKDEKILSSSVIKNMIKTYSEIGGKSLIISGGMEPFSSYNTIDTLIAARKQNLKVYIYTNGFTKALGRADIRRIILESCNRIRFSLHASNPKTFRIIEMPNSSFDDASKALNLVLSNIKSLIRERNKNLSRCRIGISFLLNQYNYNEICQIVQISDKIGVDFIDIRQDILGNYDVAQFSYSDKINKLFFKEKKDNINLKIDFKRPLLRKEFSEPSLCYAPMKRVVVNPWGGVFSCCLTAQSNINPKAYLGQIIHGSEIKKIIKNIINKVPIIPTCKTCPDREFIFNALIDQKLNKII